MVGKWINGKNSLGHWYQEKLEGFRKPCTNGGKRRWPTFSKKIDDNVKHIFREHNEADHWANAGAEVQRKVVIDRKSNGDTWKAVKGFWMAVARTMGEVGAVWSSKKSTEKDGSRSAEVQSL